MLKMLRTHSMTSEVAEGAISQKIPKVADADEKNTHRMYVVHVENKEICASNHLFICTPFASSWTVVYAYDYPFVSVSVLLYGQVVSRAVVHEKIALDYERSVPFFKAFQETYLDVMSGARTIAYAGFPIAMKEPMTISVPFCNEACIRGVDMNAPDPSMVQITEILWNEAMALRNPIALRAEELKLIQLNDPNVDTVEEARRKQEKTFYVLVEEPKNLN